VNQGSSSLPRADVGQILDASGWSAFQKLVVVLTALTIIIDGIDNQLLGIAIPAIVRDWNVPRAAFAPVLSAGFVGMMFGGAVAGMIGDRVGRRIAMIGSVVLFGIATIAASMTTSLLTLGILRFFVGCGLQGAAPNAAALVAEYVPRRHRAFSVTLIIVCIPLGATLAGLVALPVLPVLGWRALFVIGGLLPLAVGATLAKFLPESPRYLAQRPERWLQLAGILQRMGHRVLPNTEFTDAAKPAEAAGSRGAISSVLSASARFDSVALWSAFFFCMLAVYSATNWVPSVLTGAGLSQTVASTGITAFNLGGVIGALTGAVAITRFGSKPSMLGMALVAAAGALIMRSMTITAGSDVLPIYAMLVVTGGMINGVQVTLYALSAHMYETSVRATGVGTATGVGRLGAIASPYVGNWALEFGGSSTFFGLIAAGMLASFASLSVIRRHIPGIRRVAAVRATVN
jgi:AAHS family 4-hydroxybenzoate transporter-like MFS transporter